MSDAIDPSEIGNAIGSTEPTVEDRAHWTPEMWQEYWRDVNEEGIERVRETNLRLARLKEEVDARIAERRAEPRIYSLRKGAVKPPPDAVYVGRGNARRADCPSNPWYNPFTIESEYGFGGVTPGPGYVPHNRAWACSEFEEYASLRLADEPDWLEPLRGKSLVCWCKPKPESAVKCHAETLRRLANQ